MLKHTQKYSKDNLYTNTKLIQKQTTLLHVHTWIQTGLITLKKHNEFSNTFTGTR